MQSSKNYFPKQKGSHQKIIFRNKKQYMWRLVLID